MDNLGLNRGCSNGISRTGMDAPLPSFNLTNGEYLKMHKLIVATIVSMFVVNMAFAADSGCEAKAVSKDGKPLAGAAKAASIKKCEKEAASAAAPSCADKAVSKDGKPLFGAAKAASIKKCEAEAKK